MGEKLLFSYEEKNIPEQGRAVDPDFLNIFSFPLIKGDQATALTEPNTLIITEGLARKYFGQSDPIGKLIRIDKSQDYKVVGLIADVPLNSTLRFDYLRPFQPLEIQSTDWTVNAIQLFAKLAPNADPKDVTARLNHMARRDLPKLDNRSFFLHGLKDWYLRTDFKDGKYNGGGRITYVRLFGIIATFVLLIACINFVNLSTAKASRRAREVGVRKAIGASQGTLITQFLSESILLTFVAGAAALGLLLLTLPFFNGLLEKPYFNAPLERSIFIDWGNPWYYIVYVGILLFTGLIAGLYPAFVLSSFKPVKVLKGLPIQTAGVWLSASTLRKSLVVVQFTTGILLLVGTAVVYKQISFIQNINLGYKKSNVVFFNWRNMDFRHLDHAKEMFSKIPGVKAITLVNTDFLGLSAKMYPEWPGQHSNEKVLTGILNTDYNLLQTMEIQLSTGRNFSQNYGTDSMNVLLNEEAVRRMRFSQPIGQPITVDGVSGTVIGVVKNFHLSSVYSAIEPMIIRYRPQETQLIFAQLDGHNISGTIQDMEKTYQKLLPGFPLNHIFLDQGYDWIYRSEKQISTLANWFSGLAIFISCLGLFGLTTFSVERRTKEIGVRKVLGASILNIFTIISIEFIILVLIAIVLAAFPSWYFMNDWLSQFAYKVDFSWWMIAFAGIISVCIALFTISFQAIKAALINPVQSLRSE